MFTVDTFDKTKLLLTRGDDGYVELPIFQKVFDRTVPEKFRYVKYLVQDTDSIKIEVRKEPIVNDETSTEQTLVFVGNVAIQDGVPIWHITHEQSQIDCNVYYWDAQITMSDGVVSTYNSGLLQILPEVTL